MRRMSLLGLLALSGAVMSGVTSANAQGRWPAGDEIGMALQPAHQLVVGGW